MIDITETISAKDRLAGSRAALLHEMGFNVVPPTSLARSTSDAFTATASMALQPIDRPSPWASMGKRAVKNWWAKHPANAAMTLAKPSLGRYAQVHPCKFVACGAAVGAVLFLVRPWHLLSASTIAALVLKRSTIAGIVTSLADHFPATRNPVISAAGLPKKPPYEQP